MDFITLVKTLRREVGASGESTTVASPVEGSEWQRLINWTAQAWMELQLLHTNWKWMRATASFTTTAGKGAYTLADMSLTDHAEWYRQTFRIYLTSSGTGNEQHLTYMDYEAFRDAYLYGTSRDTTGRPTIVTIDPDDGLIFFPKPDDVYTVEGDYQKLPTELTANADEPDMPDRFHMLIVYDAMKKYAIWKAAADVYQRGEIEGAIIRGPLRRDQLPNKARGRPLV